MNSTNTNKDRGTTVRADTKSPKLDRNGQPLSRLALLIEKITTTSPLTQREIADIAGFKNQNIITMIKQGDSKLSLERVPGMAKALGVDPYELFLLALEQSYSAETREKLTDFMPPVLTPEEKSVIDIIRAAGKKGEALTSERINAIRELFN